MPDDPFATVQSVELEARVLFVQRMIIAAGQQRADDELDINGWIELPPTQRDTRALMWNEKFLLDPRAIFELIGPTRPRVGSEIDQPRRAVRVNYPRMIALCR